MNLAETMKALEAAGSEQTRKTLRRHGVTGPQFGVSYAVLKTLAKKIKTDHELAVQLWETGNHDARILALMIADPKAATAKQIDAWVKDLDSYVVTDAFGNFVASTPYARARAEKWPQKLGHVGGAGWVVICNLAMRDSDVPDAFFEDYLKTIEKEIHQHKDRRAHGMNQTLIAIGARNPRLTELALAAARRIGKVEVDHGDTSCKTPDAADYIHKMLARKKKLHAC
jgi:3-methyladenine DNA glycosylase AlkD